MKPQSTICGRYKWMFFTVGDKSQFILPLTTIHLAHERCFEAPCYLH